MLKETEETIVFFVTFLSLVGFQLGGARAPFPPGYAYAWALPGYVYALIKFMLFRTQGVMIKIKQLFTKKLSTSFAHYALFSSF